jgi:hypothetical protein
MLYHTLFICPSIHTAYTFEVGHLNLTQGSGSAQLEPIDMSLTGSAQLDHFLFLSLWLGSAQSFLRFEKEYLLSQVEPTQKIC